MKVLTQSITQENNMNNLFIVTSVWNHVSSELCVDPQPFLEKTTHSRWGIAPLHIVKEKLLKTPNPCYSKGKYFCYLIGIYMCKS